MILSKTCHPDNPFWIYGMKNLWSCSALKRWSQLSFEPLEYSITDNWPITGGDNSWFFLWLIEAAQWTKYSILNKYPPFPYLNIYHLSIQCTYIFTYTEKGGLMFNIGLLLMLELNQWVLQSVETVLDCDWSADS